MSALDVEALLDSAATAPPPSDSKDSRTKDRSDRRRDKDRREGSRDRDRKRRDRSRDRGRRDSDKKRDRDAPGDEALKSPGSTNGHRSSKRRSKSRDSHRSRRHRDEEEDRRGSAGDYYRGGGRARSRSRSPNDDRYYRPIGKEDRFRERSPRREREEPRKRSPSPRKKAKSPTPEPTEDERDRRTVFVQQLAARLRTKELIAFFEKIGPVKEAQIVKDRVSGRSKGYVDLASSA